MFNIQVPKALAFPAIMIVGGALQATLGYFVTRKVVPVIKADQDTTGKAQSIFLAVSALYTLVGSGAMNYGVKYVLENRVSVAIPKLWNAAAFVGQALLVGVAIYYARVMPVKELPKAEYERLRTQADELNDPLEARIAEAEGSEEAVIKELQAVEQAFLALIEERNKLPEGTVKADEIQRQDQALADIQTKITELQGRLQLVKYQDLKRTSDRLHVSLAGRISEAEGSEEAVIKELQAVEQAFLALIEERNKLPEGTVEADEIQQQDRALAYIQAQIAELQGRLQLVKYQDLKRTSDRLHVSLEASIAEAERSKEAVIKELQAVEQAFLALIEERNKLPEGTVEADEIRQQDEVLTDIQARLSSLTDEFFTPESTPATDGSGQCTTETLTAAARLLAKTTEESLANPDGGATE